MGDKVAAKLMEKAGSSPAPLLKLHFKISILGRAGDHPRVPCKQTFSPLDTFETNLSRTARLESSEVAF